MQRPDRLHAGLRRCPPFLLAQAGVYRYLEFNGWKYRTMGKALDETIIINRANVEGVAHSSPQSPHSPLK